MNCQGNHTANDATNCPVSKKAIELKANKQKEPNKQNVLIPAAKTSTSAIRTTQSFADRVKFNQPKKKTQNMNIDKFMNNQNKMMNDFMAKIQEMQQQFMSTFGNKNG